MAFKNYRDESRTNWGTSQECSLNLDQINTGAILRIADATEVMAKHHQDLINDRDWYKKRYEEGLEDLKKLDRKITAMKGVITKLKRKP